MKKLNLNTLKVTSFVTKLQENNTKGGVKSNQRRCFLDSIPYCDETVTYIGGTCTHPC